MATDYMYGNRDLYDRGIWSDMGRWGTKRPGYDSGYDRPMGATSSSWSGKPIGGSYYDTRGNDFADWGDRTRTYGGMGGMNTMGGIGGTDWDRTRTYGGMGGMSTLGGAGGMGSTWSDWDRPLGATKMYSTGWHPACHTPGTMACDQVGRFSEQTHGGLPFSSYGGMGMGDWDRGMSSMTPYQGGTTSNFGGFGGDRYYGTGGFGGDRYFGFGDRYMGGMGGMGSPTMMGGMSRGIGGMQPGMMGGDMMGGGMMGSPMMGGMGGGMGPMGYGGKMWRPRCDIIDGQQFLTVEFELPGVSKEHINLSVGENFLILQSGENFKMTERTGPLFQNERHLGQFYRRVELPFNVDTEKCQATLEHGLLRIVLPKKNISTTGIMSGSSMASPITTSPITTTSGISSAGTPSSGFSGMSSSTSSTLPTTTSTNTSNY